MKFNVLDLRLMFEETEANRVMAVLNSGRSNFKVTSKRAYKPFIHRSGTKGKMLLALNTFDINDVIEVYENRLTSVNHRHVYKRSMNYLKIFYKIKHNLELRASPVHDNPGNTATQ